MPDPIHLLGSSAQAPSPQPTISYGRVSSRQPAPSSFTDPLFIVFPDYSADHAWKIENWPCIHGNTLPALGADVLVLIDERHNKRVVWWQGTFTPFPDPD